MRNSAKKPLSSFDAIVIGASAGGMEALLHLAPALPAELDAAVLVVLHTPANRPSLAAELLRPRCALPVVEADGRLIGVISRAVLLEALDRGEGAGRGGRHG